MRVAALRQVLWIRTLLSTAESSPRNFSWRDVRAFYPPQRPLGLFLEVVQRQ
jgi:hypothetical protein